MLQENLKTIDVLLIIVSNTGDKRTLDSRCSYHMFSHNNWFNTYQLIDGEKVLMC